MVTDDSRSLRDWAFICVWSRSPGERVLSGMETRDLRPNLVGTLTKKTSAGVVTKWTVYANQYSRFGTRQTRSVDKTPKASPLPLKYGIVEPVRACIFDKVTGVDDEQKWELPWIPNYDGYQSKCQLSIGHYWSIGTNFPSLLDQAPTAITAAQKNYALTMALSRVSLSGIEGSTEMAELPETVGFLKSPLSSITRLVTGVRYRTQVNYERNVRKSAVRWHTNLQKHRDLTDAFAGTWLAGRYAVTPLLLSTSDLAETAAGKYKDLFRVYSAKGTKKETFHLDSSWAEQTPYWPIRITYLAYRRTYEERKAVYTIRYYPAWWNPDVVELARWGLSPTQLPSTVYEVIPFSFMLDWVSNLGMWIKALQPKPELTILDTCLSEKWTYRHEIHPYSIMSGSSAVSVKTQGGVILRDYLRRTIVTNSLTAPQLSWRSNGIKLLQATDIAALAAGTLARKLTPLVRILERGEDRLKRYGLSLAKRTVRDINWSLLH